MSKKILLIVDDEDSIADLIKKMLKNEEITVLSVGTVEAANAIIDTTEIDILVVDYNLTNGKGYDVILRAKQENSSIPSIMISGGGDTLKIPSLETGANFYLQKPFDLKELKAIILNLLSLSEAQKNLETANDMIVALSRAIDFRDTYTQGHSDRVSFYAVSLYDALNFEDDEKREALKIGCLLHDIGKIGTPDSILKSNEKLSDQERKIVQMHPVTGYEICKDLKTLKDAVSIIRSHHEKIDGSGYPDKLQDLSNLIQIVAIADIYDALTSDRTYREKNSPEEAFVALEKEAEELKLNKKFVEVFKKVIL